jgi:CRISPR type I-E-associated protein CasB/Cse2
MTTTPTEEINDRATISKPNGRTPSPRGHSFTWRVTSVAGWLERLHNTRQRGALAELRRLRPGSIPGEAFWDIVGRFGIPEEEELFWRAIIPLMVRHPHRRNVKPGRAIEAAGISKPRFERWLRLDRDGARAAAGRLLSKLGDDGLDWTLLGRALHRWNDNERYLLARDFFLARERRESSHTDGAE